MVPPTPPPVVVLPVPVVPEDGGGGSPEVIDVVGIDDLDDTFGINPFVIPTLSSFFPSFGSINMCPSGGCLSPPAIRPASPLYEWHSQYA